ncbi:FAST kinase domain-containing protein 1, mitochondrial [Penaeus vannamei]|uniref:FAST kinase domain-containing protein 1, mitochondrial n=1 Tax=Penaeus vannamei TaxID=6689 RepID=UPI00387F9743
MLQCVSLPLSPSLRQSGKMALRLGAHSRGTRLQHFWSMAHQDVLQSKFIYARLCHRTLKWPPRMCALCAGSVTQNIQRAQLRFYASSTHNNESDEEGFITDSEFDIDDFDRDQILDKDQFDQLRVVLYKNPKDPVVKALSVAASVQEVFDLVEKCQENLTVEQTSQAIITLWDLQKLFGRYSFENPNVLSPQVAQFLEKILSHPIFMKLLEHLENSLQELENNAVACMLLYLHRIGISSNSSLMQKLSVLCQNRIENFNLSALSRLSVYLRDQGLKAYFLQSKAIAIISANLRKCSTADELKLITICLSSTRKLITESLFLEYQKLVNKLFDEGELEDCEVKVIIKILKFLSYPEWSPFASSLSRKLMMSLVDKVSLLTPEQVIAVNNYFQSYLEPRDLLLKIQEHSASIIEEHKSSHRVPDLLLCLAPYSSLKVRNHLEELVAEQLDDKNFLEFIPVIFKILRYIKTSNIKLCNAFWTKAMRAVEHEIKEFPEPYLGYEENLRRGIYHRYMYFNNNLGGTYRHYYLEKNMTNKLYENLKGQVRILPSKVAQMTSFILSYNDGSGIPDDLLEQIIEYAPQLSIFDTIVMSRGIQITLAFHPNNTQRNYTKQITTMCHMLNGCTERHIKNVKSLLDVTSITRAYLSRKGSPRTFLFEMLVHSHIPFIRELNSRHLRNIAMYFQHTKYLAPELLDAMADYIIENEEYVLQDTVERMLTCIYYLGYHPTSGREFFSASTRVLEKGAHHLQGLNTLQVCLSLALYNHLSSEMIHNVFNIKFLDQLDEEIDACYSKASYPSRVRHLLMELNRAVCIDQPEEGIPWFHEKYCEELLETVAVQDSVFHTEVHQVLSELIGNADVLRANAKTPYFYLLDFEFMLDENNRPVPVSVYAPAGNKSGSFIANRIENKKGYRRIAVLLHNENSYCINSRQLIGRYQLQRRHLEVLGYTVVEIPHFMWYSMALGTYEDKVKYLRSIIYHESS